MAFVQEPGKDPIAIHISENNIVAKKEINETKNQIPSERADVANEANESKLKI
jgi:hypothetical protein